MELRGVGGNKKEEKREEKGRDRVEFGVRQE